jgi:hypothetical protein
MGFHPCGIIADVATDVHNGQVLEEATGYAKEIFVVFPRDGELAIGRGTVYSHYEFKVDAGARMTDEQWHEWMRDQSTPLPTPAAWKTSYIADLDG